MRRFGEQRQVFFFEEFIPTDHHLPYLEFHSFEGTKVTAVRPRVPREWNGERLQHALVRLLSWSQGRAGRHECKEARRHLEVRFADIPTRCRRVRETVRRRIEEPTREVVRLRSRRER